jgi:flagellar L-ring protein precursor FlgH
MKRSYVFTAALISACAGAWGDSLFTRQVADRGTLISEDKMRFQLGDVITVLVRERIDASANSLLNTKKKTKLSSEADASDNATFVGDQALIGLKEGELPNFGVDLDNKHESDGTTRRRNQVVFTVACTVTKVLPNGTVEVRGEKSVTVNRDASIIHLSGTARTRDVSADNTIDSNQLAGAQIELKGQGPLWNNQRRGLFTRLLDWVSPF